MDQNIIVNESSRNLKLLSKDALNGKWGMAIMGTLIYSLIELLPDLIFKLVFGEHGYTFFSCVYSILTAGPMTLGYAMFTISIFRKRQTSASEVLFGFEHFGKAFCLSFIMGIRVFLWTLLLIVPGIIAAYRYSMAFNILADNPQIGVMEALNKSKQMMYGNKWGIFGLQISFIGWAFLAVVPGIVYNQMIVNNSLPASHAFLCFIITLIGQIFFMPYFTVTTVAFYDIANGSLKSVRKIESNVERYIDGASTNIDPITVYKEQSGTTETTEATGKEKKETEMTIAEGTAVSQDQENPKIEE